MSLGRDKTKFYHFDLDSDYDNVNSKAFEFHRIICANCVEKFKFYVFVKWYREKNTVDNTSAGREQITSSYSLSDPCDLLF